MTDRTQLADQFLQTTKWANASRTPIAGDASRRCYDRLTDPDTGQTAILMDAPPEDGEDVRPFIKIAEHLGALGFSAPNILYRDNVNGFLLLEDLGDDLFARIVITNPDLEVELYSTATEVLASLHDAPLPAELGDYGTETMTNMAALAYSWYRAGVGENSDSAEARFRDQIASLLDQYVIGPQVLIQRDYHAENLLWLPGRNGVARVGLLDFQDAMTGHRAYDLVSLLQDARRDVPQTIETAMISHYLGLTSLDRHSFEAAYHLLGIQRNLRILGVFARLCLRDGKPHYIGFMPRVWGYITHSLAHPVLQEIADTIRADLPEPTPEIMQHLKAKCSSLQMQ